MGEFAHVKHNVFDFLWTQWTQYYISIRKVMISKEKLKEKPVFQPEILCPLCVHFVSTVSAFAGIRGIKRELSLRPLAAPRPIAPQKWTRQTLSGMIFAQAR